MGLHQDRVIWVTGAASGIGRATVEEVVAEGGLAIATDLPTADLRWTDGHDHVIPLVVDVTSEADNEAAVDHARSACGRLDGAVFSAGVARSGELTALPMEQFDQTMEVNVRGMVLGMRAAARELPRGGAMVAIASTSGLAGDPGMWPYNTSKGAVVNLVRATSVDLGARGIRVNAVCPGPTETAMTTSMLAAPEVHGAMRRRIPLGRWGTAHDQAAVVSFLLSDKAGYVNGAIIPVDGGITANTGQFFPPEPS